MDEFAQEGLKVDFHIHSTASNNKNGSLVKDGAIENIPILLNKLKESNIDRVDITDYDLCDYRLYHELKEYEVKGKFSKKYFLVSNFLLELNLKG